MKKVLNIILSISIFLLYTFIPMPVKAEPGNPTFNLTDVMQSGISLTLDGGTGAYQMTSYDLVDLKLTIADLDTNEQYSILTSHIPFDGGTNYGAGELINLVNGENTISVLPGTGSATTDVYVRINQITSYDNQNPFNSTYTTLYENKLATVYSDTIDTFLAASPSVGVTSVMQAGNILTPDGGGKYQFNEVEDISVQFMGSNLLDNSNIEYYIDPDVPGEPTIILNPKFMSGATLNAGYDLKVLTDDLIIGNDYGLRFAIGARPKGQLADYQKLGTDFNLLVDNQVPYDLTASYVGPRYSYTFEYNDFLSKTINVDNNSIVLDPRYYNATNSLNLKINGTDFLDQNYNFNLEVIKNADYQENNGTIDYQRTIPVNGLTLNSGYTFNINDYVPEQIFNDYISGIFGTGQNDNQYIIKINLVETTKKLNMVYGTPVVINKTPFSTSHDQLNIFENGGSGDFNSIIGDYIAPPTYLSESPISYYYLLNNIGESEEYDYEIKYIENNLNLSIADQNIAYQASSPISSGSITGAELMNNGIKHTISNSISALNKPMITFALYNQSGVLVYKELVKLDADPTYTTPTLWKLDIKSNSIDLYKEKGYYYYDNSNSLDINLTGYNFNSGDTYNYEISAESIAIATENLPNYVQTGTFLGSDVNAGTLNINYDKLLNFKNDATINIDIYDSNMVYLSTMIADFKYYDRFNITSFKQNDIALVYDEGTSSYIMPTYDPVALNLFAIEIIDDSKYSIVTSTTPFQEGTDYGLGKIVTLSNGNNTINILPETSSATTNVYLRLNQIDNYNSLNPSASTFHPVEDYNFKLKSDVVETFLTANPDVTITSITQGGVEVVPDGEGLYTSNGTQILKANVTATNLSAVFTYNLYANIYDGGNNFLGSYIVKTLTKDQLEAGYIYNIDDSQFTGFQSNYNMEMILETKTPDSNNLQVGSKWSDSSSYLSFYADENTYAGPTYYIETLDSSDNSIYSLLNRHTFAIDNTFKIKIYGYDFLDQDYNINIDFKDYQDNVVLNKNITVNGLLLNAGYVYTISDFNPQLAYINMTTPFDLDDYVGYIIETNINDIYRYSNLHHIDPLRTNNFSLTVNDSLMFSKFIRTNDTYITYLDNSYEIPTEFLNPNNKVGINFKKPNPIANPDYTYKYNIKYVSNELFLQNNDAVYQTTPDVTSGTITGYELNTKGLYHLVDHSKINFSDPTIILTLLDADDNAIFSNVIDLVEFDNQNSQPVIWKTDITADGKKVFGYYDSYVTDTTKPLNVTPFGQGFDSNTTYKITLQGDDNESDFGTLLVTDTITGEELNNGTKSIVYNKLVNAKKDFYLSVNILDQDDNYITYQDIKFTYLGTDDILTTVSDPEYSVILEDANVKGTFYQTDVADAGTKLGISLLNYEVYSASDLTTPLADNAKLGTGMVIKLLDANNNPLKYIDVVVTGDLTGDGNISLTDLSRASRHVVGLQTQTGNYVKASDINGDGNVTLTDLSKLSRHLVGLERIK